MTTTALSLLLALTTLSPQQSPTDWKTGQQNKELYIPKEVGRVPADNDYTDPESEFSFTRMVEGPNVAVFWAKEYGDNPQNNPNPQRTINPYRMLEECERYYRFYVNEMEYVKKGRSVSDDRKLLVYVFGGDEGTAYGGGSDNTGIFWTPAVRINKEPYGVVAHELAHSFQYMSRIDSGASAGGGVNEMAAQYFLWQVLPTWQTFENYHLNSFMEKSHFAFLHPTNIYHSPYVIEYWSNRHGLKFWGELNRQTQQGEDVVTTYKRLQNQTQDQFNDEMFDAYRHFVTWDLPRIQETSKPFRNQHSSKLVPAEDGWYRISPERVPQNYGYNAIKLQVPAAGTTIRLQFQGIAGAEGYNAVNVDKAGWRYGFVAYKSDETRTYSPVQKAKEGSATFTVPEKTESLWLVVMGAPTEHWPLPNRRRGGNNQETTEEAWPYRIKLTGTSIDPAFVDGS